MMHTFPRTFSLATSRSVRVAPPTLAFPPLTPATYLRLCRHSAGLSRAAMASRLAPRPADVASATDLLALLETHGAVARKEETLERLRAALPFDPDVYRQLACEPPERHPRVCRGCAATAWTAPEKPLRWANDNACTRCAGTEGEGDVA